MTRSRHSTGEWRVPGTSIRQRVGCSGLMPVGFPAANEVQDLETCQAVTRGLCRDGDSDLAGYPTIRVVDESTTVPSLD